MINMTLFLKDAVIEEIAKTVIINEVKSESNVLDT